mmetsp:Transcript_30041/g.27462  ORF Transcript_30041/g.27462 Transcript_30041/m.27462 type:complete len:353 (-) Transcript_30041:50-1108(-)
MMAPEFAGWTNATNQVPATSYFMPTYYVPPLISSNYILTPTYIGPIIQHRDTRELKKFMNVSVSGSYYTPSDPDAMYIIVPRDEVNCSINRFDANTAESTEVNIGECYTLGSDLLAQPLLAVNFTYGPSAMFLIEDNLLRFNHNGKSTSASYCEYTDCIVFGSMDLEKELAYVITIAPYLFAGVITQDTYNISGNATKINKKVLSLAGAIAQIDDHNFLIGDWSANSTASPLKVYNTIKQDFIWKGEITRNSTSVQYEAMVAAGFEISGDEVKAGYAVMVDSQANSYFYDVISKEKYEIPYNAPRDYSYALYRASKYSVTFVSKYYIDTFEIKDKAVEVTREAQFLAREIFE